MFLHCLEMCRSAYFVAKKGEVFCHRVYLLRFMLTSSSGELILHDVFSLPCMYRTFIDIMAVFIFVLGYWEFL